MLENSQTLLHLDKIDYSYPSSQVVLNELSLAIKPGESIVLLGANGSGKSTLLKILGGLLFAKQGKFMAFGHEISERLLARDPFGIYFRTKVGMLFQNSDAQLFNPTVEDEIAFGPIQLGEKEKNIDARVNAIMAQLGVVHLRERSPFALSGGEKRKVAIASILVMEPDVLLLDEPTAGLDSRSAKILVDILLDYRAQGKTLITATHDLHIVSQIASRVIVMGEDRRIIADDNASNILGNHELLHRGNLIHFHPGT